ELFWTLARGYTVVLHDHGAESFFGVAAEAPENQAGAAPDERSITSQILRHGVTHLQCTPSMMRMLLADPATLDGLTGLRMLLLGGEALPAALAEQVLAGLPAELHNMYGPTET